MSSRRGFFRSIIAALIAAPLIRLGWMKARAVQVYASFPSNTKCWTFYEGQNMVTHGWAEDPFLKPGYIITIASVYQENPRYF